MKLNHPTCPKSWRVSPKAITPIAESQDAEPPLGLIHSSSKISGEKRTRSSRSLLPSEVIPLSRIQQPFDQRSAAANPHSPFRSSSTRESALLQLDRPSAATHKPKLFFDCGPPVVQSTEVPPDRSVETTHL